MQRYSKILDKIPREIVLLKSLPCIYGKCSFCNYILDNSLDINEINNTNLEVLQQINGEFGVLEVINSGSVFEIPQPILNKIRDIANSHKINTLYFEVYYGYRRRLNEMRKFFSNQEIRYCIGLETFDDDFREKVYNKPFPTTDIEKLSDEFYNCRLLICVTGQTKEQILNDLKLAQKYFREVTVNLFIDNDTAVTRDPNLVTWFINEVYPGIKDKPNFEILIDNKDLGVYVQ